MLRSLFLIEAHFDSEHKVVHTTGEENGIVDALLRNDISIFSSLLRQAAPLPSATPQSLIELLSNRSLLWTRLEGIIPNNFDIILCCTSWYYSLNLTN